MDTQVGAAPTTWSRIKGFISSPITGFAIGIIGIILAVYFYYVGISEPKLILLIHPVRTPITLAGKLSEISVLLHGKPINGDLTAVQFILWNSGKAPVRHEDILKPVVLLTFSNCPIYEATIRSISRDITSFQLITNDMSSGRLSFDWRILEHNDGASIQILYGGDQKMPFLESGGVLVGQSHIPFEVLNVNQTTFKSAFMMSLIMTILSLFCANIARQGVVSLIKSCKAWNLKQIFDNTFGVLFFGALTVLLAFIAIEAFLTKNAPPFWI